MDVSNELKRFCEKYLLWMSDINYSGETVEGRRKHLRYFNVWAEDRSLLHPREITSDILTRYRTFLANRPFGKHIKAGTQRTRLSSVKEFFKWMTKERHILFNPAVNLEMPRVGSPIPSAFLTAREVEIFLSVIDLGKPTGLRDRAMFEVFYSSGIRRKELCNLKVNDLDMNCGLLMVREGKGGKDRLIPIGDRALLWVDKYLRESRYRFLKNADEKKLFLTRNGPMKPEYMTGVAHSYFMLTELDKKGACHIFRHSMATLMLDGGADIRHIQEMLGHSSLESTQIYTRIAVKKLKDVHSSTHPGAQLTK